MNWQTSALSRLKSAIGILPSMQIQQTSRRMEAYATCYVHLNSNLDNSNLDIALDAEKI